LLLLSEKKPIPSILVGLNDWVVIACYNSYCYTGKGPDQVSTKSQYPSHQQNDGGTVWPVLQSKREKS